MNPTRMCLLAVPLSAATRAPAACSDAAAFSDAGRQLFQEAP